MGHEVIYYEVDVVSTERYSDDVDIWNSHSQTCYLQVMSPGQTLHQMSPSPMSVNIQGYACSNPRT